MENVFNNKLAIVSNGVINDREHFIKSIGKFKYIACADGGCKHVMEFNLKEKILFVAGDFDSFPNPENYFPHHIIYKFNPEKDYTDSYGTYMIAKKFFTDYNFKEFHFFACSGKREDHFLSLIFSFVNNLYLKGEEKVFFHTDYETFYLLKPGKHIIKKKGYTFSLFPLLSVKNLRMKGTKYNFKKRNLKINGIGVSNIFVDDIAYINFEKGIILLSIVEHVV